MGAPTTSRYVALGTTLLVISTFAGTLTLSALLTIQTSSDQVKSLLGFASALFLGSVTGFVPIILALQRYSDNERPTGVFYGIVIIGYTLLTAFISVAFILLMIIIKHYTVQGA